MMDAGGEAAVAAFERERQRSFGRALMMARGEYGAIRAHPELRRPIAGGAVHSHPEQEEQMHRDYDRRAYASLAELQQYDALTKRMNAAAAERARRPL